MSASPIGIEDRTEAVAQRIRDWIAGEPVTGRNEFGNGYREALRDIADVMNGRGAS